MTLMEDLTGRHLGQGRYELIEKLGSGGMGTIYKAYQPGLDRLVAIKILPRHFAEDATFVERFTQEAEAAAKLQHPYIVPVFDYGLEDRYHYIVMRFVKSEKTLAHSLQGQPLPLAQIPKLIDQVGNALDYAHSLRVIHRDVKPSNILISNWGHYLLADFGIAKLHGSARRLTDTGTTIGTPAYMSPEQIRGEKIDGRSDLYSLGVVLYEMAAGRLPFQGEIHTLYAKHLLDDPPSPHQFNPDLPDVYERVILKLLTKEPDGRYSTARAIAKALRDTTRQLYPEVRGTRMMEDTKPIKPPARTGQAEPVEQIEESPPRPSTQEPSLTSAKTSPSQSKQRSESPVADPSTGSSAARAQGDTDRLEGKAKPATPPHQPSDPPSKEVQGEATDPETAEDLPSAADRPAAASSSQQLATDKLESPASPSQVVRMERPPVNDQASRPVSPPPSPPKEQEEKPPVPDPPLTSFKPNWFLIGGSLVLVLGLAITFGFFWLNGSFFTETSPPTEQPLVSDSGHNPDSGSELDQVETKQSEIETMPGNASETEPEPEQSSEPEEKAELSDTLAGQPEADQVDGVEMEADQPNTDEAEAVDQSTPGQTETKVEQSETEVAESEQEQSEISEEPVEPLSPDLSGKLAIPLLLGIEPKVYIAGPTGQLLGSLGAARQPDYTLDGAKLIVNGDGGPQDKLRVSEPTGSAPFQIGDPGLGGHSHPFWSPDGTRVIYDDVTIDPSVWRIFIRSLDDNQGEGEILRANAGPIIGQNPLWAGQNRFIFRGCNTWANNPGDCGIWVMQGNAGTPLKLTNNFNHIPTDVYQETIVYASPESGDWNIYSLNLTTGATQQLTFDAAADGLATISPDGRTVAFLSDRQGALAVWHVDIEGGNPPEKFFDIPADWGIFPAEWWTEEKLSWATKD